MVALQKLWKQSWSEIAVKPAWQIDNFLPPSQEKIYSFPLINIKERNTKEGS